MTKREVKISSKTRIHPVGRGFSRQELLKAGTNTKEALRLHIAVDLRRRSLHEENVQTIKTYVQDKKPPSKPRKKPKA